MSSPFERGRRRAEARQAAAREVFAKQLTKNVDVETLLLDKLMQRTKGGSTGIMQQFKKLDSTTGDQAEISFDQFKDCLVKFGLEGLHDKDARKLFRKYDEDGSGTISFREFSAQVANFFNKSMNIGYSSTDIQDAKRARDRARILKQQAVRTGWKTISVDAERLLLEKIEQRLKGGNNALRLAFRRFDSGKGDSSINFDEFQESLKRLGLQGIASDDALHLFRKFDADGNGTIEFSEFVEFVMKSSASHNSISLNIDAAAREAQRLRDKALTKQRIGNELHWRYAEKNMDIEGLFIDKVLQKLKGGSDALRRAFCLFDKEHGDSAEIDIASFRTGLESLGLVDIPLKMVRRLFRKYDSSGDGIIDFAEFVKRISRNCSPLDQKPSPRRGKGAADACCKHCCCHSSPDGKRHRQRRPSSRATSRSSGSSRSYLSASSSGTQSTGGLPQVAITGRSIGR